MEFFQPLFGGGDIGVDGLIELRSLLGIELLALLAELHALELVHLERQLLELGIAPVDLLAIVFDASLLLRADITETRRFKCDKFFSCDRCTCNH